MAGQLIPPPGFEPKVSADATPEQRIRMWVDLMDTCEQSVLARRREEIGPDGDLKAAYRNWYREQMAAAGPIWAVAVAAEDGCVFLR